MIFKDIVNIVNTEKQEESELRAFQEQITEIKRLYEKLCTYLLETNIKGGINAANWSGCVNQSKQLMIQVQEQAKKVNLMRIGKLISKMESCIESDSEIYEPIEYMTTSIEICSDKIYEFINSRIEQYVPQKFNQFIEQIELTIESINIFFKTREYINMVNSVMQNKSIQYSESSILEIRLFRNNMQMKEISEYMLAINNIYERACTIFGISTSEYKLIPIKLESGSWYENLLGKDNVVKFIEDLLDRAISFIYRNYTNEGKLTSGHKNKIEALKDEIGLLELCENHGIDVQVAKDVLEQNLTVLCADTYKLTTGNNKIAISGKVYDAGEELSRLLLEEQNKKYLDKPEQE